MSEPAWQNIPIRTELSEKLRKIFEESPKRLVVHDYMEIELRLLSHLTQEEIDEIFGKEAKRG